MVSTMDGPIPPHPYYDRGNTNPVDRPVPRVRPEARDIASKHAGSVGFLLQLEGQRIGSAPRKFKPEPKDHMKENLRRMRRIQRESRKKQEDVKPETKPVKALWKSSKYDDVQSKVVENLQKEPDAPRPHSANYLRAHSRTGFVPMSARPASTEPSEDKLSVPKALTAREVKLIRRDLDFIKLNGKAAKHSNMKRAPSLTALDDIKKKQEVDLENYNKKQKGEVPKYLLHRQKSWKREEEERKAAEPDPELPEGHRLMDQQERRETLEKLKQSHKELLTQMASLPIRTDTLRVRQKKEETEKKIAEVEEAIKIFSRPKVFVKLDE